MTSLTAAPALSELGQTTLRKVRRRLMPLIVLLYFVAYLDRTPGVALILVRMLNRRLRAG